jgi:hypothetical protein
MMSNPESKLTDALNQLRAQSKNPDVEIIPDDKPDIEVDIDQPKKEPRRSEFVQTDDPKVIERINDLYGQVKKSDAAKQMLIEHNKMLEQKIAEHDAKFSQYEQSTKTAASDKVETELKTKLRQAREEHDLDAIEQIEDKLFGLREEKLKSSLAPQVKSPPVATTPQVDQNLVNNAAYLQHLSQERDSVGNLKRPYLYDWDPDNKKAVELFQSIPQEFAAAGKQVDLRTIIEVMDERIKGKKQQATSVLSGDGDDIPTRKTVRLTQDQANVAKRMGISTEAYARQLQLINS